MKNDELLWAILPEGLDKDFEIESFEKTAGRFRIVLIEKNIVREELPEMYRGKRIINSVLNNLFVDDFPIRGRKGEILLRRRSWKFKDVDKLFTREIDILATGTKLEKEFADFLKEFDRE